MVCRKTRTDGAEADAMTCTDVYTFRAMTSGYILKRHDTTICLGIGGAGSRHAGEWKRHGKIKRELLGDNRRVFEAMQSWADGLVAKGYDAEMT